MSTLHYRTRAGSAPGGKPRLYFCCHPEDFPIYFDSLSQELLDLWDCAIWYRDLAQSSPWGADEEEDFCDSLLQMQLFVIPVSEAFLMEETDARTREFTLAADYHIPVLPILVNSGLAADFNRICGNIQFLDRTSTDLTEIPYRQKLENFLRTVLVPDDLARQVRAAFDAYVFLSYRKKDRRYAQELMKLIHENEFCRDIAIWYDEFLTPGENFNASIQEALEKSHLFALAVTPNLVNEKNYVMDIEYPMAQKEEKKILPVELQDTDRQLLKQYYQGLPSCVTSSDKSSLKASLMDSFQEIAVRENDNSPEHLLFIGLAYLGGIDVEVDPGRGVKLIEEAAFARLPQAMEKLVSLYRTGYGVPLDQEKAIAWQKKLAATREEEFARTGTGGETLLADLQDLAELYLECQQYSQAAGICQKLQETLEKLSPRLEPETARNTTLWLHSRLAACLEGQGNLPGARDELLAHQKLVARWAKESPTEAAIWALTASYDRLGQLAMTEGNLSQALQMFQDGKLLTDLADEELHSTLSMSRRLTMGLQCGNVLREQKKYRAARETYTHLLPLAKRLARDGDSADARRLAICYMDLGRICSNLILPQNDSLKYARQSLAILEDLTEKEPTYHNLRNLAVCCNFNGDTLANTSLGWNEGVSPDVLQFCQRALEISQKLVCRSNSLEAWLDLAHTLDRFSRYYGLKGDRKQEKEFLSQAADAARKAAERSGSALARRALASYLARFGQLYEEEEDMGNAKSCCQESFALHQMIYEETRSLEDLMALASDHQILSRQDEAAFDYDGAKQHKQRSIELCEEAVAREPSVPAYQNHLARYCTNMAQFCHRREQEEEARHYWKRALNLSEELYRKDPSSPNRMELSEKAATLGDSYCEAGSWEEAWPYYQRYLELRGTPQQDTAAESSPQQPGDAWNYCCNAALRCGHYEKAKELALQVCTLRREAWQQMPEDITAYDMACHCFLTLIEIALKQKDFESAEDYGEKYREMICQIPALFPEVPAFHGLSLPDYAGSRIRLLAQTFEEQAKEFKEKEAYDEAENACELAIHYAEVFVEMFPDHIGGRKQLGYLNYTFACIVPGGYYSYYLEESLKIWEALAKEMPENSSFKENARIIREILEEG